MTVRHPGEEPVGPSPRAGVDRLLPRTPEHQGFASDARCSARKREKRPSREGISRDAAEVGASDNFIGLRLIGKETPEPTTVNLVSVTYEWHGHTIEIEVVD